MKIDVKFYPAYEDITVQGGQIDEDGLLWVEWCNHAGATEEKSYNGFYDSAREQLNEWYEDVLACDKCDHVEAINTDDSSWEYDCWRDSQL